VRLFADFVFHFELFVAKPGEHLLGALALAHFHAQVQWGIVVDISRQVVCFVGQQHFDYMLTVVLASVVQWSFTRFISAF